MIALGRLLCVCDVDFTDEHLTRGAAEEVHRREHRGHQVRLRPGRGLDQGHRAGAGRQQLRRALRRAASWPAPRPPRPSSWPRRCGLIGPMSPRRRGRGRHGGPAAAAAPDRPPASGGQTGRSHRCGGRRPRMDGRRRRCSRGAARPASPLRQLAATQSPRPGAAGAPGSARIQAGRRRRARRACRRESTARPKSRPATEAVAESGERKPSCTLAQMRRFIKSRPYVPRPRAASPLRDRGDRGRGQPHANRTRAPSSSACPRRRPIFLGELVKSGEVGCELLLDPVSPAVVGVFPMRPVARQ